jgi:TUG ubiquitin-like domain
LSRQAARFSGQLLNQKFHSGDAAGTYVLTTKMASNVVILHNNRRHVIKTTPSMLCREILVQACEKVGFKNIENYGLKYELRES